MALDIWINSDIRLFKKNEFGLFDWLGPVTIDKVWWYENGHGRMRLQGPLKVSEELNHLENGDTIEAQIKEAGSYDVYMSERTIIRLTNCQIKRKWMLDLAPNDPDDMGAVILYVSITCDVELLV